MKCIKLLCLCIAIAFPSYFSISLNPLWYVTPTFHDQNILIKHNIRVKSRQISTHTTKQKNWTHTTEIVSCDIKNL